MCRVAVFCVCVHISSVCCLEVSGNLIPVLAFNLRQNPVLHKVYLVGAHRGMEKGVLY